MQPSDIKRVDKWLVGKSLPPHLKNEFDYYLNDIEWDDGEQPTVGEALCEWMDRHEYDKSAGWLDRPSWLFCRRAMVETGIAKAVHVINEHYVEVLVNGKPGNAVWFRYAGATYEYRPEELLK